VTATTLLDRLHQLGVTIIADGDHLRLRPRSLLTPEDLDALRTHKPELLALLRRPRPPALWSLWPDTLPSYGKRTTGPLTSCSMCTGGTWAYFGAKPFCLSCTTAVARASHAHELRKVLDGAFDLNSADNASPETARYIADQIARLTDECGPDLTRRIIDNAALEFYRRTSRCPYCGAADTFHPGGRGAA
jgi:hypothetical protein